MKRLTSVLMIMLFPLLMSGMGYAFAETRQTTLQMKIDGVPVTVEWEDNASVAALRELAVEGLTIEMSMYGGFEQVDSIGQTLPSDDVQTTTVTGDIVLYSGSQLVVFYGSNSWAYTRLGKFVDLTANQIRDMLAKDSVAIDLTVD